MSVEDVWCHSRKYEYRGCRGRLMLWGAVMVLLSSLRLGAQEVEVRVRLSTDALPLLAPQQWNTVRLSVSNRTSQARRVLCVVHPVEDETLQFGRWVWVAAQSTRLVSVPVKLTATQPEQTQIDLRALVIEHRDGHEVLLAQEFGELKVDQSFRLMAREQMTVILDRRAEQLDAWALHPISRADPSYRKPVSAGEVALTARFDQDFGRNVSYWSEDVFPGHEVVLDAVDQLVISDDRLLHDPQGLMTVRSWVARGGRLWLWLPYVDPELPTALLGEAWEVVELQRTSLSDVRVQMKPQAWGLSGVDAETRHYDPPVAWVQVHVPRGDILCRVEQWPAAFQFPYGEGMVLVTTLGAEAWVRPRMEQDPTARGGKNRQTDYVSLPHLEPLGALLFNPRPPRLTTGVDVEPTLTEQIGYQVPARWAVLGLLTAMVGLLCVAIGRAQYLDRREHLVWFVPLLSLGCSGAVLSLGASTHQRIEPLVVFWQWVQPLFGTSDVHVQTVLVSYSPSGEGRVWQGEHGGIIEPDLRGTGGGIRRLIWQDEGRFAWEGVSDLPGIRRAEGRSVQQVNQPWTMLLTPGPQTWQGRWQGPIGFVPEDSLLITAAGRLPLMMNNDGTVVMHPQQVLADSQFLAAELLDDQRQRRQRLLEAWWQPEKIPPQPYILLWSPGYEQGWQLGPMAQRSSALTMFPCQLLPPPEGTTFTIPAPLLPYHEAYGPDGTTPTGFYDARTRRWSEKQRPSMCWLHFEPPSTLLPLKLLRVRLTLQVRGPVGRLELATADGERVHTLHTWNDPVGTLTFDIDDPLALQLSPQGGWLLRVSAGQLPTEEAALSTPLSFWQIEKLSAEWTVQRTP
ncbi:MAG: hypothetical protein KatS3mg113_0048 [Planctomycetaceae bacterium]|nr:MAG: hypothetical protein KatS3mg113_0048 [Planctomycetaceae bacterium]